MGVATAVEGSIHPQALGWWILGLLAALVGLVVVGQALARQSTIESEDYPTMAAIGADRRQLFALGMARSFVVGLVGALGALAVAFFLSPVAPLGEARTVEASTGLAFDPLVLPLGAIATLVAVLVLGVWPAVRAAQTSRLRRATSARPSVVVGQLSGIGAPPSAVVGVRNALQGRTGGANVPIASALVGTVLAVVALCGTAVFGSSLTHLTATPLLYGDPFQLNITNSGPLNLPLVYSLEHNPSVTGITRGFVANMEVNKVPVSGVAVTSLRGSIELSKIDGTFPRHRPDRPGIDHDAAGRCPSRFGRSGVSIVTVGRKGNPDLPGRRPDRLSGSWWFGQPRQRFGHLDCQLPAPDMPTGAHADRMRSAGQQPR